MNTTKEHKSLREKLKHPNLASHTNNHKTETKILILEKDSLEEPILSEKENVTFKDEINTWKKNHNIDELKLLGLNKEYDNLINALTKEITKLSNLESEHKTLKHLLRLNQTRDAFLQIPRQLRLKVIKRLDSLIIKQEPLFFLFEDSTIKKILLSTNIKIVTNDFPQKELKLNIFYSEFESILLRNIIENSDKELKPNTNNRYNFSILVEALNDPIIKTQTYSLKKIYHKHSTLLDLMRDKIISLEAGNMLIKYLNKNEQGLMITGASSSGKTRWLSSVSSIMVNSKYPTISANPIEIKKLFKDHLIISKDNLADAVRNNSLDILADRIAKSHSNLYIADDCDGHELALSWILHTKFAIPSILTFCCTDAINTILHHTYSAIKLLNYKDEKEFFFWCLSKAFPILIDLNMIENKQIDCFFNTDFSTNSLFIRNYKDYNDFPKLQGKF